MIKLAVSDTPLSRKLIQEGSLEVDLFETSGPLTEAAVDAFRSKSRPFLLHNAVWDWSLSNPDAFGNPDVLRLTRERLLSTRAPFLSVHLGYSAAHVAFEKGSGFVPAKTTARGMTVKSETLERDTTFETIVRNVQTVQGALEVPLIVENLDFNPTGAYDHICEPDFIAQTLTATGAGLLLDLAHAQVSASRLGYNIENYLASLPLHRVKQLHISGTRRDGDTLFDAHEPLREADYTLLAWVLSKTDPVALTLEYGKGERALLEQVRRLKQIIRA